jgi:hypothetical protein
MFQIKRGIYILAICVILTRRLHNRLALAVSREKESLKNIFFKKMSEKYMYFQIPFPLIPVTDVSFKIVS